MRGRKRDLPPFGPKGTCKRKEEEYAQERTEVSYFHKKKNIFLESGMEGKGVFKRTRRKKALTSDPLKKLGDGG